MHPPVRDEPTAESIKLGAKVINHSHTDKQIVTFLLENVTIYNFFIIISLFYHIEHLTGNGLHSFYRRVSVYLMDIVERDARYAIMVTDSMA